MNYRIGRVKVTETIPQLRLPVPKSNSFAPLMEDFVPRDKSRHGATSSPSATYKLGTPRPQNMPMQNPPNLAIQNDSLFLRLNRARKTRSRKSYLDGFQTAYLIAEKSVGSA